MYKVNDFSFKSDLKKDLFQYFIFLLIISIPIFGNLTVLPIRIWDESRLAINAYEMSKNGNWLVTHYKNSPDLWNLKPPFLIWMQVICIKILGFGELAIRLPSAIAAFLTCVALLVVSVKYLKDFTFGFVASIVLVTSLGYMDSHAARTGDYDAMLTFFATVSALYFLIFIEKQQTKHLYLFFLFLTLATLTKGIISLAFLPAYLIYCIWQKRLMDLVKNKHVYIGALLFLFFVVGYYMLREAYNPGYIRAVQENEWGGRYLNEIEGHEGGFWFYYNLMIDNRLNEWYLLVPCGLALGLVSKNERIKKLIILSTLIIVTFFIVISTAKTKLEWYDVPLYPFTAILISAVLTTVFVILKNLSGVNNILRVNLLPVVFLFVIFIVPYKKIIHRTQVEFEYAWDKEFYEIGYFMKGVVAQKDKVDNCYLLVEGIYHPQNDFYLNILKDRGVKFTIKDYRTLSVGDSVITANSKIKEYMQTKYNFYALAKYDNVVKYRITAIKGF